MIFTAVILGLIEGLTEFLPVSSTGHLIVAGHLMGYTGRSAAVFEVVIQLGAILAVVWEYRARLWIAAIETVSPRGGASSGLARNLLVGFVPAGVAGLLLHRIIEEHLFGPLTVGAALVAGGIAMIGIERTRPAAGITSVTAIPWTKALWIGMAQALSLFPGVSRAAATIMGGMVVGLDRRTATEFSFYLAIPTMLAVTGYDL
ncbi:MAG TPA: undecaprenyl-diphosphate phosphatase, partial [Candidatus Polarisedimenticolia bacterium]|nr:undecaprenyl-diphosphate phosphatase [Candidatus Polarisedimenticolia bacterium]